jgi:type IV pilus assembly protein PilB
MATERVKLLDPAADAKTIAARYRCEFVDLREANIDHDLFRSIPVDLMFQYNFVPMHAKNGTLEDCTMERAIAYSTVIEDLNRMAAESGMQTKETSYVLDPVEGSDRIEQLTISANFEGSYGSLTKLVNMLDKSQRFLIIDSLQASPQSNGALNVNIRLVTFVRQTPGGKS